MASRPKTVKVWYRGIPYYLDLLRCRRALVARQVDGDLDSMESLASAVGISRSTASRFFSGRPTSLAVTLRILEALHLTFADVAKPVDGDDDADGASGVGAERRQGPRQPTPGGSTLGTAAADTAA
jgi:transcriptional regulator with XRE-family HTH domain